MEENIALDLKYIGNCIWGTMHKVAVAVSVDFNLKNYTHILSCFN